MSVKIEAERIYEIVKSLAPDETVSFEAVSENKFRINTECATIVIKEKIVQIIYRDLFEEDFEREVIDVDCVVCAQHGTDAKEFQFIKDLVIPICR